MLILSFRMPLANISRKLHEKLVNLRRQLVALTAKEGSVKAELKPLQEELRRIDSYVSPRYPFHHPANHPTLSPFSLPFPSFPSLHSIPLSLASHLTANASTVNSWDPADPPSRPRKPSSPPSSKNASRSARKSKRAK